jgi:hypothetical protein
MRREARRRHRRKLPSDTASHEGTTGLNGPRTAVEAGCHPSLSVVSWSGQRPLSQMVGRRARLGDYWRGRALGGVPDELLAWYVSRHVRTST